jgi:hypothetical protein
MAFLDTANTFEGWKIILDTAAAWVQYNSVDFGNRKFKSVNVRASSRTGGTLELRSDRVDGPVIARVDIPECNDWNVVNAHLLDSLPGIHHLIVLLADNGNVEIDWISFE